MLPFNDATTFNTSRMVVPHTYKGTILCKRRGNQRLNCSTDLLPSKVKAGVKLAMVTLRLNCIHNHKKKCRFSGNCRSHEELLLLIGVVSVCMVCNVCKGRRKNEEEDCSLGVVVSVLLSKTCLVSISSVCVVVVCWVIISSALAMVVSAP